MKYKIVSSYVNDDELRHYEEPFNFKLLEERVNKEIENGYIPIGGVSVRHGSAKGAYMLQAMIKEENGKEQLERIEE